MATFFRDAQLCPRNFLHRQGLQPCGYIGIREKKMETSIMGYIGIMEKEMETTIMGYIGYNIGVILG